MGDPRRAQIAVVFTFNADVTTEEEAIKICEKIASNYQFTYFEYQTKVIDPPFTDAKYDRDSWHPPIHTV